MSHRLQRALALIMAIGLLSILLTACSQSDKEKGNNNRTATSATPAAGSSTAPASSSAEPKEINIDNYAFKPAELTVTAGTKVTWVNKDKIAHTATSNDKRFDSGLISPNTDFSYTFTAPGIYAYHCTPHPRMTGQIIVK